MKRTGALVTLAVVALVLVTGLALGRLSGGASDDPTPFEIRPPSSPAATITASPTDALDLSAGSSPLLGATPASGLSTPVEPTPPQTATPTIEPTPTVTATATAEPTFTPSQRSIPGTPPAAQTDDAGPTQPQSGFSTSATGTLQQLFALPGQEETPIPSPTAPSESVIVDGEFGDGTQGPSVSVEATTAADTPAQRENSLP